VVSRSNDAGGVELCLTKTHQHERRVLMKTTSIFLLGLLMATANCSKINEAIDELRAEVGEEASFSFASGTLSYDSFDHAISGESFTPLSEMPVSGTLVYEGDWSFGQADGGSYQEGVSALTANFGDGTAVLKDGRSGFAFSDKYGQIEGNLIVNDAARNGANASMDGGFHGTNARSVGVTISEQDDIGGFIGTR